ncbi:metalloprotease PmbA [Candidatus Erwinia haradaeae]|uniref:Metalloprotease PmbA n=1 Tax=Candidatus Erwinia haradaeae TaxID=1922217 RepID=A0A451D2U4_9GAMM|nr:metalloprotease PmbA [Candidatus Erwinia haradaeae]VFP79971.1 Metalloprotease PmbA [Candidatus Erwinia haradaeae]
MKEASYIVHSFDIKKQRASLEKIVSIVLDLVQKYCDGAQIIAMQSSGIMVKTNYGLIENIEFNKDVELLITLYKQKHTSFVLSTDLSLSAIKHVVQVALNILRYTSMDLYNGMVDRDLLAWNTYDLDLYHPTEIDIQSALHLAARAEQAALKLDPRIINTEGSIFNNRVSIKVIGNSYGMLQGYCTTWYSLSSGVIAKENSSMERGFSYTVARAIEDLQSPEYIGKKCASHALSRLSSKKLLTMKVPVVFAAEVAISLFRSLAVAISGEYVYRKCTFLLNAIGQQILPQWLSIEEHPHILKGIRSAPFDNEGVQTQQRDIVKDGILQSWLLSNYTARRLGLQSTGHAGDIYNWLIVGCNCEFDTMLKQMEKGFLITQLMGHGVNEMTGDYSRGASGFWVENGIIQYPVSGVTVAGNLKEMWKNIVSIGNDVEKRSSIQCGSIFLSEMKIGGD